MDNIMDLGCGVFIVSGKIIWVKDGAIDVDTDAGREWLIKHSEHMRTCAVRPNPYGPLTADIVYPKSCSPDGTKYPISAVHFGSLPDDVKPAIRKEFPDYADKI